MQPPIRVLSPQWRIALRQVLPVAIAFSCLWLLLQKVDPSSFQALGPSLAQITPLQWVMALIATALSFWALGRYDVVIHRHFRTGIPARAAAISGAASIALSQMVGFGAVTGALARWRILPRLSAVMAAKVTLSVAVSFLLALAPILGAALWISGANTAVCWTAPLLVIPIIIGMLSLIPHVRKLPFPLPSVTAQIRILTLTLVDTLAAAAALYIFLPAGADLSFQMLYTAYLTALAVALVTGAPGGLGAFELTLFTCLPQLPEGQLLTAIVAFRLVYYAVPAVLAIAVLARPIHTLQPAAPRRVTFSLPADGRAELGVCAQNRARAVTDRGCTLAVVETRQTATALFDPIRGTLGTGLPALSQFARNRNLIPLVYKCNARAAVSARQEGWYPLHIADDAVLNPTRFTTDGPEFRQLRRKLRQARAASVICAREEDTPGSDLREIDQAWQASTGVARGLSMGQFCPDYLAGQRLYVARIDGQAVGFTSFHVNRTEICLDLMRATPQAPNGTMHALIMAALQEAADEGYQRLSLAALPRFSASATNGLERHMLRLCACPNAGGLTRFKTCFAPRREALYALAPNRAFLALGLADLALAIRTPISNAAHQDHEENQFAVCLQT